MIPPANHGSYGGKYSLLVIAFKYAKFIGFSLPKDGCHRSGLAALMNRNRPKQARKTPSSTISNRRSAINQARSRARLGQATAKEPASSSSQTSSGSGRSNGASLSEATSQLT